MRPAATWATNLTTSPPATVWSVTGDEQRTWALLQAASPREWGCTSKKNMDKLVTVLRSARTAASSANRARLVHAGVIQRLSKLTVFPGTRGSSGSNEKHLGDHATTQGPPETGYVKVEHQVAGQELTQAAVRRSVASAAANLCLTDSVAQKTTALDDGALVHIRYLLGEQEQVLRLRALQAILSLATCEEVHQGRILSDDILVHQLLGLAENNVTPLRERELALRCLAQLAHHPKGHAALVSLPPFRDMVTRLQSRGHPKLRLASKQVLRVCGFGHEVAEPHTINILSIDGGGTRALATIEMLKRLRDLTGREIHDLFDLIAGTSTGGILAYMIGIRKRPLEDIEQLYKDMSQNVFLKGYLNTGRMLLQSGEYYDTSALEQVLRDFVGNDSLSADTTPDDPKVFALSVARNPTEPFLFRNYTPPPERPSRYSGSSKHRLWEALRATSAAPTFFKKFSSDNRDFLDGGMICNNPTGIAVHEAKKLWGSDCLRCVVSLGTGSAGAPIHVDGNVPSRSSWMADTIKTIVDAATDTEVVHHVLQDVLLPGHYYRFNPVVDKVEMDENDLEKLGKLQDDTRVFIERHTLQFAQCADMLIDSPGHDSTASKEPERAPYTWSLRSVWDDLLSRVTPKAKL